MTHWGRFDSFRSIKSEMRRPGLTVRQKSLSERGFVFMRWKERFLVPDHQVRGIRGASYDGFYYVCVQLNSQAESPVHTHSPFREPTSPVQTYHPLPAQQTAPTPVHAPTPPPPIRTRSMSSASARSTGPISPEVLQSTEEFPPLSPVARQSQVPASPPSPRITRAHSNSFRSNSADTWGGGGRGTSLRAPTVSATMTGFYFHQNSEPYQQLTLHYQPERNTSAFEFR
ncbi:vacuolar import and degradation protein [Ceratobasidium sp. AG-Ba]|nr:vacuolar import and degradation protein [Ceratobasidium sp. AG-Ba]QRW15078.1 vacuolar import and degradation protein [Ceratobasidium sp. AG-Ba]